MTSRQRVLSAINHKQPDRVPIDFGGHRSSGISAIAYAKLKKSLGINSGDIYVYDIVQQLAIVEKSVLDVLKVDVIELGRGFMLEDKDWQPWVLPDGTPCKIPGFITIEKRGSDSLLLSSDGKELGIQKKGCLYFEQIHFPRRNRPFETDDFSDLAESFKNTMWTGIPAPGGHIQFTDEGLAQLEAGAKQLRQSTDRAIVGLFGGNLFEVPQFFYGIDQYLLYMGLYPDACLRLSEKLVEFYMPRLEKWLKAVGPYIDIVLFGDDLGGQNGPLISPEMYRLYFKPYHKQLWNYAKKLAKVKVQLHSCGGIEPLLNDLIDAGLDIVNPVQISCNGMDSHLLKRNFGDRLTFWGGGCDTRDILPSATPDEVKKHVHQQIRIFGHGGGFVFQQVHNILANVPARNIIAMFEAAQTPL